MEIVNYYLGEETGPDLAGLDTGAPRPRLAEPWPFANPDGPVVFGGELAYGGAVIQGQRDDKSLNGTVLDVTA